MNSKLTAPFFFLAGLLMVSVPTFAHHGSQASYDLSKRITVTGTVTEFVWRNPHCQTYMDVKDDKGNVTNWGFEMNSPGVLSRRGWTKNTIKPGDKITVTAAPSRVPDTPVAIAGKMVLPSGQVVYGQIDVPREGAGPAQ